MEFAKYYELEGYDDVLIATDYKIRTPYFLNAIRQVLQDLATRKEFNSDILSDNEVLKSKLKETDDLNRGYRVIVTKSKMSRRIEVKADA